MTFPRFDGATIRCRFVACRCRFVTGSSLPVTCALRFVTESLDFGPWKLSSTCYSAANTSSSAAQHDARNRATWVKWELRWVRHRGPCREARRLVADGVAPLRPVEAVIGLLLGREHQLSAAPPRCQEPGYQVAWALRWVRHRGPWYSRTMGQPDYDYSPDDSGRDKRDDWPPTLDGARLS